MDATKATARPYRSKSVKPCDACRRRRVACIRKDGEASCSLCNHRKTTCTFLSNPQIRRGSKTYAASLSSGSGDASSAYRSSSGKTHRSLTGGSSDKSPLDLHTSDEIETLFTPIQEELVRLFYRFVHPSFPILGPRQGFDQKRQRRCVPGYLLATVYLHGAHYWHTSPLSEYHESPLQHKEKVVTHLYSSLMDESVIPTLEAVQASLLFMQFPPRILGAYAAHDFWKFSAMTVAMSQSIGLHMDPDCWEFSPDEQKLRRVVSWALFINDKWMAHWLSRPPHVSRQNFGVQPLTLLDFSDDDDRLAVDAMPWVNSFVALSILTDLLSDVLDKFYSVQSRFDRMTLEEVLRKGRGFVDRLTQWKLDYPFPVPSDQAHQFTVQIGSFSVCLAIHCAIVASHRLVGSEGAVILASNTSKSIRRDLLSVLLGIQQTRPLGLWLNYNKGIFISITTSLLAIVQSSKEEESYPVLKAALIDYVSQVRMLADEFIGGVGLFDFARWAVEQKLMQSVEAILAEDEHGTPTMSCDESSDSNITFDGESGSIAYSTSPSIPNSSPGADVVSCSGGILC